MSAMRWFFWTTVILLAVAVDASAGNFFVTVLNHTPEWAPYAACPVFALIGLFLWHSDNKFCNLLSLLCFAFAIILFTGIDFYIRLMQKSSQAPIP